MPDETERAELIRQLSENDVDAPWCGPDGIMCKAAAQLTADAAMIAELRAELAEARAAIRDVVTYWDGGANRQPFLAKHAAVIAKALPPAPEDEG
jgi:glycerate kinase